MIRNEKEILTYLSIPSLPKKKWDKVKSFKYGVATLNLVNGGYAYAVCTYNDDVDGKPKITKVFSLEPYLDFSLDNILVVPDYMNVDDVDNWDINEESKEMAKNIIAEAKVLENGDDIDMLPTNEYCYDFIHSDEEAIAYIRSWNKKHGIKRGRVPSTHNAIVAKLTSMWANEQNKFKNKNNGTAKKTN